MLAGAAAVATAGAVQTGKAWGTDVVLGSAVERGGGEAEVWGSSATGPVLVVAVDARGAGVMDGAMGAAAACEAAVMGAASGGAAAAGGVVTGVAAACDAALGTDGASAGWLGAGLLAVAGLVVAAAGGTADEAGVALC